MSVVLKVLGDSSVQLRRATLYPAELRVRESSFSRLAGPRQRAPVRDDRGFEGRSKARKARITWRIARAAADPVADRVKRVRRASLYRRIRAVEIMIRFNLIGS